MVRKRCATKAAATKAMVLGFTIINSTAQKIAHGPDCKCCQRDQATFVV